MKYHIQNEFLAVEAEDFGAELTSVRAFSREWLWQNENGAWGGHAPVLFPYCGCFSVYDNGKQYPLTKHGFARKAQFFLKEKGEDFITFCLQSNESAQRSYPYLFSLEITYRLQGAEILVEYRVKNCDNRTLYFGYGGHESYLFPCEGEYKICFPQKEHFCSLVHDGEGMLTGEMRDLGEGTELTLKPEYFEGGNTLIFGHIHSRSATLATAEGNLLAESVFEGMEHLLLWSPCPEKTICIEPWYNLPDRVGDRREIAQKGLIAVPPNGEATAQRRIKYIQ